MHFCSIYIRVMKKLNCNSQVLLSSKKKGRIPIAMLLTTTSLLEALEKLQVALILFLKNERKPNMHTDHIEGCTGTALRSALSAVGHGPMTNA